MGLRGKSGNPKTGQSPTLSTIRGDGPPGGKNTQRNRNANTRNETESIFVMLPLIRRMATHLKHRLPMHVDLEDLIGDGMLGYVRATRRYDAQRKTSFRTYAQRRILGEMLDGLRRVDTAGRPSRQKMKSLEHIYFELQSRLGRAPDDEEMARALGISLTDWHRTVMELLPLGVGWSHPVLSAFDDKGDRKPDPDRIEDSSETALEYCLRHEQKQILRRALRRLPKRESMIIELYYLQGRTMNEIGKIIEIDITGVSRLHKQALSQLKRVVAKLQHFREP